MQGRVDTWQRIGPFNVDLDARRVCRDGAEIRLSVKAAGVLRCLVEADGRVVTRNDLLDMVWPQVHVGEEVLTQAIAELRRAFGDQARQPSHIETIPRSGYRLIVSGRQSTAAQISESAAQPRLDAAAPLPSGPSIVVLPFDPLVASTEALAVSTGLSRDIAVSLARSRWLMVTGRGSATSLRAEEADPIALARRLGTGFALSGHVLTGDDRLRISVQLCDATTTETVWGETYERPMGDLFSVIDDIAREIGSAVKSSIDAHLRSAARIKPIESLDAWGLYHLAGGSSLYAAAPDDFKRTQALLLRSADLAPNAARIVAALASLEFRNQLLFERGSDLDGLSRIRDFATRAIDLDPDEPDGLVAMGCVLGSLGDRLGGRDHLLRAVKINPTSFPARVFTAWSFLFSGQNADALAQADVAYIISPHEPANFHVPAIRAHALALAGEFEDAYAAAEICDLHPRSSHLASPLAAWCAVAADRPDRARFHIERLRAARPDFTLADYFIPFPFDGETRETISRYLSAAGL